MFREMKQKTVTFRGHDYSHDDAAILFDMQLDAIRKVEETIEQKKWAMPVDGDHTKIIEMFEGNRERKLYWLRLLSEAGDFQIPVEFDLS